MKYTESQFNSLVDRFNSCKLPKSEWTHEAHILVAFWHVWRYSEIEALNRVRQGIKDYNTSVGTINSDTSGYHETLTVFWLKIVRYFLSTTNFKSVIQAVNRFVEAGNAEKTIPLQFYSNELLFSKNARRGWVEPDKISLDKIEEIVKQPTET